MALFVGAFMPGTTQSVSVGTSSAVTALGGNEGVMISNTGANIGYVLFGTASAVATVNNAMPVFPNQTIIYTIPPGATHIATIAAVATTFSVTIGAGL